jgi:hypothetical protein
MQDDILPMGIDGEAEVVGHGLVLRRRLPGEQSGSMVSSMA